MYQSIWSKSERKQHSLRTILQMFRKRKGSNRSYFQQSTIYKEKTNNPSTTKEKPEKKDSPVKEVDPGTNTVYHACTWEHRVFACNTVQDKIVNVHVYLSVFKVFPKCAYKCIVYLFPIHFDVLFYNQLGIFINR